MERQDKTTLHVLYDIYWRNSRLLVLVKKVCLVCSVASYCRISLIMIMLLAIGLMNTEFDRVNGFENILYIYIQ